MSKRWIRWCFCVLAVGVLAVFVLRPSPPSAQAKEPDDVAEPPQVKDPFFQRDSTALYPAGDDATTYAKMTPAEQEGIDALLGAVDEHHGQPVHDAWNQGTAELVRHHKRTLAERRAGLENIADLGAE